MVEDFTGRGLSAYEGKTPKLLSFSLFLQIPAIKPLLSSCGQSIPFFALLWLRRGFKDIMRYRLHLGT
jgi:hypothetical protein